MTPTIGRIVHYVSYGTPGGEYKSVCRAAIVTEVGQMTISEVTDGVEGEARDVVSLAVMNPEGMFFNRCVTQDEQGKAGGSWHWPERV